MRGMCPKLLVFEEGACGGRGMLLVFEEGVVPFMSRAAVQLF